MHPIRLFARDIRGGIAIAFGLSLAVMGMAVGLAIDTARIYSVSNKVQAALDSAALSGAKWLAEHDDDTSNLQQVAQSAFNANVASLGLGDVTLSNFSATPDTATSSVNVGVQLRVPATLAKFAGLNEFSVQKTAGTSYSLAKLEVVLSLDVTGSMNEVPSGDFVSKLQALKGAATSLVDSLFADATTDSNVRISVVPWSSGVHAGSYAAAVSGSSSGGSCLAERAGDGATTDSTPSPLTFANPLPASSIALGYACPTVAVSPLKGRREANNIKGQINSLTGIGGTAGHLGTAWAWYMLSPTWTDLHPTGSRPEAPSRTVIKTAVIMTDGVFNTTHIGGVLDSGAGGYSQQSYEMFKTLCDGMKAQNIRVYTIAFDLTDSYALSKLEECAGANALTASTSTQLHEAFRQIAADINSIRMTR